MYKASCIKLFDLVDFWLKKYSFCSRIAYICSSIFFQFIFINLSIEYVHYYRQYCDDYYKLRRVNIYVCQIYIFCSSINEILVWNARIIRYLRPRGKKFHITQQLQHHHKFGLQIAELWPSLFTKSRGKTKNSGLSKYRSER